MFSFLFGQKKPANYTQHSDKIWVSQQHKYNGLYQDLSLPSESVHFVVVFFKKTIQQLQNRLEQKALNYIYLEDTKIPSNFLPGTVIILLANQFENNSFCTFIEKMNSSAFFHFVEHYPKWSTENNYLLQLQKLSVKVTIQFYNSLDEPLFQKFGGHDLINLMHRLGMQDDECISHKMVDRSIQNMQKKLDKSTPNEIKASSLEEWLSVNTSS